MGLILLAATERNPKPGARGLYALASTDKTEEFTEIAMFPK